MGQYGSIYHIIGSFVPFILLLTQQYSNRKYSLVILYVQNKIIKAIWRGLVFVLMVIFNLIIMTSTLSTMSPCSPLFFWKDPTAYGLVSDTSGAATLSSVPLAPSRLPQPSLSPSPPLLPSPSLSPSPPSAPPLAWFPYQRRTLVQSQCCCVNQCE